MLKGKTVVLAISGSIAAYKMANVARMLLKQHCDVEVLMTAISSTVWNMWHWQSGRMWFWWHRLLPM